MSYEAAFDFLSKIFDEDRCTAYVAGIHENDRWFDTPSFQKTAEYCYRAMNEAGLSEVEMLPLKSDGKTAYGDWVIPKGWDAVSARLTAGCGEAEVALADYEAVPCSLVMYSSPTPPQGVTARAVVADSADEFAGLDVRGKIILTRLSPSDVFAPAKEGEALGIASDCMPLFAGSRDSREEVYDTCRWDNTFQTMENAGLFAFSLSPRKGDLLRNMLANAPDTPLRAQVEARRYDAEVYTVSGLLRGAEPDAGEILIYGHLYEPGAHDNASGCGMILELARALALAVEDGSLPRPKRGIRFVLGYECCGSMGFAEAHPEIIARAVCGLVADMVGSGAKNRCGMSLWHNPSANWSYIDPLLTDLFAAYARRQGAQADAVDLPFTIGTDNILADPCFGTPTAAVIMHPALSYHSSMDTMELIEPEVLRHNGIVVGGFLCYMANAGAEEAHHLSELLEREYMKAREEMPGAPAAKRYLTRNAYARATLAIEKLLSPAEAPEGWRRVPKRTVMGCLTFDALEDRASVPYHPAWNNRLNVPLFWADGARNLWQIAELSAADRGGQGDAGAQYAMIAEYFGFLAERGYIEWVNP